MFLIPSSANIWNGDNTIKVLDKSDTNNTKGRIHLHIKSTVTVKKARVISIQNKVLKSTLND